MKRRDFIKSSVVLTTAAGVGAAIPTADAAEKAVVKRYRKLGRTDMEISDISFGTGRLPSASMILRGVDRGINYFDTAPDYGRSEEYMGEAMQRLKQRDKIYLASKFCDDVPYEAGVSHLQVALDEALRYAYCGQRVSHIQSTAWVRTLTRSRCWR